MSETIVVTTVYTPPPPKTDTALLWTFIGLVLAALVAVVLWVLVWPPVYDPSKRMRRRSGRKVQVRAFSAARGGADARTRQAGDFTSKTELAVLHCLAIALHAVSGGLGLLIAKSGDPKADVFAPLFEYLSASTTGQFATPRPRTIFSVHILVPSIIVEFITAGFHCIYLAALFYNDVDSSIRQLVDTPSANPLRWVEYAITATTMSAFGSLAIGINDFYYFLKVVFGGVCLQVLGYGIEILDTVADKDVRDRLFFMLYYVLGQLTNLPSIAILLYQIFASKTHGAFWLFLQNTLPFALWFNTFGLIAQLNYNKWRQFRDPYFTERWYIVLSLSTKIAVFWLSFGTFKEIAENDGYSSKSDVQWNVVRYCAMSIPAAWVILYALYDGMVWNSIKRLSGGEFYLMLYTS